MRNGQNVTANFSIKVQYHLTSVPFLIYSAVLGSLSSVAVRYLLSAGQVCQHLCIDPSSTWQVDKCREKYAIFAVGWQFSY
jgi:hypothetical protein